MKPGGIMKLKKIFSYFFILFIVSLFAIQCGSDPAAEGEKAFQAANYNLAIKHFVEARKQNPAEKKKYEEKIALAYMFRGKNLYSKSKNVKSFSGNFEKALDYMTSESSESFKKEYSQILYELAVAYMVTRPENEIQKEENLNKTLGYLEDAIVNDESNAKADSLLEKIKVDNFQKMLNRGKDFYSRAGKKGNSDYYITAEYYFQRAAYFDLHNKEAKTMLAKTRAKTLSILDNREDFAMAVADMSKQGGNLILDLTIKNYSTTPVSLDLKNFELTDANGKVYPLNQKMMDETFKAKSLQNQKLGELKFVDGIIVFSVPTKTKIEYLGYRLNEDETVKKYFP
jgi:hypothetical protein